MLSVDLFAVMLLRTPKFEQKFGVSCEKSFCNPKFDHCSKRLVRARSLLMVFLVRDAIPSRQEGIMCPKWSIVLVKNRNVFRVGVTKATSATYSRMQCSSIAEERESVAYVANMFLWESGEVHNIVLI